MSALTLKQKQALAWLRGAQQHPSTDDGEMYDGPTFYDQEVKVVFVNHHTARALERRSLITIADDCSICLADAKDVPQ